LGGNGGQGRYHPGMDGIRHDRDICTWCLRVRAEELLERDYPVTPDGVGLAAVYHGTRATTYDYPLLRLVRRRMRLDPDDDRETLWGEPA